MGKLGFWTSDSSVIENPCGGSSMRSKDSYWYDEGDPKDTAQ